MNNVRRGEYGNEQEDLNLNSWVFLENQDRDDEQESLQGEDEEV